MYWQFDFVIKNQLENYFNAKERELFNFITCNFKNNNNYL